MCLCVCVCVYVYIHIHIYIYCFYLGQRQSQPSALINYLSIYLSIIVKYRLYDNDNCSEKKVILTLTILKNYVMETIQNNNIMSIAQANM